jgi:hypothetical protein
MTLDRACVTAAYWSEHKAPAAQLNGARAVGLNVLRLGEWFLKTSRAKTRITPFARLMRDGVAA